MDTANFDPAGKYNLTPCWTVLGEEFKSLADAKRFGGKQFLIRGAEQLAHRTGVFNETELAAIKLVIEKNPGFLLEILTHWSVLMPTSEDIDHDTAVLHGSLSPQAAEEAVAHAESLKDSEENR